MSQPFCVRFAIPAALIFACSAIPAFANHGGGGAGGGFHGGGGGFHSGSGGFRSGGGVRGNSGGGRSYAAPPAGYGSSRSYGSPMRSDPGSGSAAARPGNSFSRPGGSMAAGGERHGNASSARPAVADGRWHSFGNGPVNRTASGAPAGGAAPNGSGWHVMNGNRAGTAPGAVRSFSGQGGEVWENSASRNVVSRTQSLSSIHNSFSGPFGASSVFRAHAGAGLSGSSHFASGSPFSSNGGFTGGGAAGSSIALRGGFNRFNGPFNRPFGHFGHGCWNCGFGFGGFGFGWGGWRGPWLGFGLWDPFWVDPWWAWPGPAFGYYAYPPPPPYSDSGYYPPEDYNNPPSQEDQENNGQESYNQDSVNGNWVTPNGPSPVEVPNASALNVPILIYMKNGSVLTVRDYWMIDGEFHYLLMNGTERSVDLEAVDLPRTNTENAKSGVNFIFKSEPTVVVPAPDGAGAPAAPQPNSQPGRMSVPRPGQQIIATPQPESRI